MAFCSFRITHQPCSTLFRSVQAIVPFWLTRTFLVDPDSFWLLLTMVQYFVLFNVFSSRLCVFCASAAFCNIGNSRLILKLITFAYPEADTSDTLPEVHWGCCLSKPSVFVATLFIIYFLYHCNMTWPLDSAGGRGLASRCAVAAPWLAPVCCSSVCNDSWYQLVWKSSLLASLICFFDHLNLFAHAVWANRLLTKHNPQSSACLCQRQSDIFVPPGCPRGGKNTCIFMLHIPRW